MRIPISPEEKLAITLRYMATGESFDSLMYQFRIHRTTIGQFILPVCTAIYEALKDDYLKLPSTKNEWLSIANETNERWQFPNCFGAADGKHIQIVHPHHSGATFYNYKGFFSIVLMAIADYDYKFLYVNVGCQGRISDGGVFRNTDFYSALLKDELNLPDPAPLATSNPELASHNIPFLFVADEAFPLTTFCMKPYAHNNLSEEKRIFNYRLSRFRRISENTFGI